MMSNDYCDLPPLLVFRGDEVNASYNPEQLSIYQNHPLIEALPPLLSADEAMQKLMRLPQYDKNERFFPVHQRAHLIQQILEFFQPLPVHLDLEGRFSRLIRSGYRARNPLQPGFSSDVNQRVECLRPGSSSKRLRSTATGFTIIGLSGVGKTTAVEEILLLYPQIINHCHYRNQEFTFRQLVWLKLDCPFDGSIKGLCLNFFQAVDDLLKTSYYQNYAQGRRTVDELIPNMGRVAANQSLGVLVIDEIQNLSEAKSGGHRKMLNFFVQLINTIGLPVVLVGTYKAISVLGSEFRQMRRGTGQGDLIWNPMKEDEVWQFFAESLWRYQYVRSENPLTPELSHTLYYETQGITDFAVKVYMLAQLRAMVTGKEKVTKSIIQSVARDSLCLATPVLSALKSGNLEKLREYGDIYPIDIEPFLAEFTQANPVARSQTSPPVLFPTQPAELDSSSSFVEQKVPTAKANTRQKIKKGTTEAETELPLMRVEGDYETIRQADYIRPAQEFLAGGEQG